MPVELVVLALLCFLNSGASDESGRAAGGREGASSARDEGWPEETAGVAR
jgi:hypothetical protein